MAVLTSQKLLWINWCEKNPMGGNKPRGRKSLDSCTKLAGSLTVIIPAQSHYEGQTQKQTRQTNLQALVNLQVEWPITLLLVNQHVLSYRSSMWAHARDGTKKTHREQQEEKNTKAHAIFVLLVISSKMSWSEITVVHTWLQQLCHQGHQAEAHKKMRLSSPLQRPPLLQCR